MTTTPELRAAAQQLRALATAASTDTDGNPTAQWNAEPRWPADPDGTSHLYGGYRTLDDGRRIASPSLLRGGSPQRPTRMYTQHADYIATMGPAVGLALADWLDSWTGVEISEHGPMFEDARHALAVARQILGTTKDTTVAMPPKSELRGTAEIRATALREAADEIAGIDFHPNARARSLDIAAGLVRRLRRMADEAEQTAPAMTEEPTR
ncbi:hypothetical protein [Streptomyces sp. NPDC015680]|uniref:hypothetical protein n=1 Tax=Streptomyces sp. NPDC015680 TaxID=3364962 RepID=UPI0036FFC3F8